MMKANPDRGKPYGGGSIVLVASGKPLSFLPGRFHPDDNFPQLPEFGREPVLHIVSDLVLLSNPRTNQFYRQR